VSIDICVRISLDGYFTGMMANDPLQIDHESDVPCDSGVLQLPIGHAATSSRNPRAENGEFLAYRRRLPSGAGLKLPGIVFLGGFKSDMTGSKAAALDGFCGRRGLGFLRFDYSGHGESSGDFIDGSISRWTEDALAAFDRLTEGPQIVIGSSMGGWIMLLVALARRERVKGLIGIAAAPDFTEELIWRSLSEAEQARLMHEGRLAQPSEYSEEPYVITGKLIEDGRKHLLLGQPIAIDAPVRLLQGMADPDVPFHTAERLAKRLTSKDVTVTLVKDGDHRLSRPQDLARLEAAIEELIQAPDARIAGNPSR
jgi:pimeloyl-ACP methyl ester carboxylesterase